MRTHSLCKMVICTVILLVVGTVKLGNNIKDNNERTKTPERQTTKRSPPTTHKVQVSTKKVVTVPHGRTAIKFLYPKGFTINNHRICSKLGVSHRVVVGVMSKPNYHKDRMSIRYTWGQYALRKDVALGFFLGISEDEKINSSTEYEAAAYGDIIKGNYIDSYKNLTLKTVNFLEWVSTFCPHSRFILKCDDDVFINFPRLLRFIELHWNKKRSMFGRLARKWKPSRNGKSKYFVSRESFSRHVFPNFLTGPAYLFTSDLVHRLYVRALEKTFVVLEDVFITGVVGQSIKARRINDLQFMNNPLPPNSTNVEKKISIHGVSSSLKFTLWATSRKYRNYRPYADSCFYCYL